MQYKIFILYFIKPLCPAELLSGIEKFKITDLKYPFYSLKNGMHILSKKIISNATNHNL